ncbi:MAG: hypothetical protein U9R74_05625 [Pseudomonadota bacterium]|nr:hypothetical protein [Pseudomonadota bacterium]
MNIGADFTRFMAEDSMRLDAGCVVMTDGGSGFQLGLLLAVAFVAIGVGNFLALFHLARYFNKRDRKNRSRRGGATGREP